MGPNDNSPDKQTEGVAIDSPRCSGTFGMSSEVERYSAAAEELGNGCLVVETAMAKIVGYSLAEVAVGDAGTEAEVAAQARVFVVEANCCE